VLSSPVVMTHSGEPTTTVMCRMPEWWARNLCRVGTSPSRHTRGSYAGAPPPRSLVPGPAEEAAAGHSVQAHDGQQGGHGGGGCDTSKTIQQRRTHGSLTSRVWYHVFPALWFPRQRRVCDG
jgi:hypothetical protein